MSLAALKEKMQRYKDNIDDAEEREGNANADLKEAEIREAKFLDEGASIKRRIQLLEKELVKTEDLIDAAEEKLENEQSKTITHEEARKGLEDWEMEGDEKIQSWEIKLKEIEQIEKESTDKLVEAQRRYVVIQNDLGKALNKADNGEELASNLENMFKHGTEKVKDLEDNEEEKFEREEEMEEKIKFLEEQVKQTEQRYDIAEREANKLDRLVDQIQSDIAQTHDKRRGVEQEMAESLAEMDQLGY